MSRFFGYDHDFQSVPKVYELDDRTPLIRQYGSHVTVSAELLEDAAGFAEMLFRPPTWADRAERLRYESTIRYRLRRAWNRLRYRLARWVGDPFVGPDGWDGPW